jgi:hypothetical protein
MTTDDTPAIRRAEVDNAERPEPSDEKWRQIFALLDTLVVKQNDSSPSAASLPLYNLAAFMRDHLTSVKAEADARIAELERERDDHARDLGEAIGLLRAVVAIQPHDMRETMCYIDAFLAAHPAPTPTTAAEPQNLEQE